MKFTVEKGERFVVIEPHATCLNGEVAGKLKGEFMLRNTGGQRNIILDLNRVESVDEDGIRVGLLARRLCKSMGGLFILVNINDNVLSFMKTIGLESYFKSAKDIERAKDMIFGNELRLDLRVDQ
ncbi:MULTISPECIES: STAS domain-containing protein [Sphingobacterium]|uniref:STAS domain-containing protein n=1 Tax=Sphingobacterium populi TaxID=1812824 RepID=A0ABW5UFM0_9SPHI|nr:STAS domain-containing protein [Sphingobacterium sp. CFCC 11742]